MWRRKTSKLFRSISVSSSSRESAAIPCFGSNLLLILLLNSWISVYWIHNLKCLCVWIGNCDRILCTGYLEDLCESLRRNELLAKFYVHSVLYLFIVFFLVFSVLIYKLWREKKIWCLYWFCCRYSEKFWLTLTTAINAAIYRAGI